jgi:hypothetical protein
MSECTGRNIPFTIENYAFVDQFGRETVSWIRTFESRRARRFDALLRVLTCLSHGRSWFNCAESVHLFRRRIVRTISSRDRTHPVRGKG